MGGSSSQPDHYTHWSIIPGFAGGRIMPGDLGNQGIGTGTNNNRVGNIQFGSIGTEGNYGITYLPTSMSSLTGGIVLTQDCTQNLPGAAGGDTAIDGIISWGSATYGTYHYDLPNGAGVWNNAAFLANEIDPLKPENNCGFDWGPNNYQILLNATVGGGGWGARGGNVYHYVHGNTSGIWVGETWRQTALGGAGGKAVKTNGHSVTFVGGLDTNRCMGAIG